MDTPTLAAWVEGVFVVGHGRGVDSDTVGQTGGGGHDVVGGAVVVGRAMHCAGAVQMA